MIILIITSSNMMKYWNKDNICYRGEETKFAVSYVKNHIKTGDSVFVYKLYHQVKYEFEYKDYINYTNKIIYAASAKDGDRWEQDFDSIVNSSGCYIIASNVENDEYFNQLIQSLFEKGHLELVQDTYGTLLYYFTQNNADQE